MNFVICRSSWDENVTEIVVGSQLYMFSLLDCWASFWAIFSKRHNHLDNLAIFSMLQLSEKLQNLKSISCLVDMTFVQVIFTGFVMALSFKSYHHLAYYFNILLLAIWENIVYFLSYGCNEVLEILISDCSWVILMAWRIYLDCFNYFPWLPLETLFLVFRFNLVCISLYFLGLFD